MQRLCILWARNLNLSLDACYELKAQDAARLELAVQVHRCRTQLKIPPPRQKMTPPPTRTPSLKIDGVTAWTSKPTFAFAARLSDKKELARLLSGPQMKSAYTPSRIFSLIVTKRTCGRRHKTSTKRRRRLFFAKIGAAPKRAIGEQIDPRFTKDAGSDGLSRPFRPRQQV